MDKKYKFDIHYIDTRYNRNGQGAVSARTISEAKNLFKAGNPHMKITSCIKRGEVSSRQTYQPGVVRKPSGADEGSSLGTMLLGAAVTAGVGLAAKWFSDKKKDKA